MDVELAAISGYRADMAINGAGGRPGGRGCAVLVGAAPQRRKWRRRLPDPEANLTALAAVPPATLVDTPVPVDVVQLVNPCDPQGVLAHLRTAARTPGPLLVYLTGQLTADRKNHQIHLALGRTSGPTVRYTALPWDWLRAELAIRRPGTTTVLAELFADREAWAQLAGHRERLGGGFAVWGTVAPPPGKHDFNVEPTGYTRALAELLRRSPARPRLAELHAMAAGQAHLAAGALVFANDVPRQSMPAAPAPAAPAVPAAMPAPPSPVRAPQAAETQSGAPKHCDGPGDNPRTPSQRRPLDPQPTSTRQPKPNPRAEIRDALRAGRHAEAAALAASWEQQVLGALGPKAPEMVHVIEAQAQIAFEAGELERATERWIAAAEASLGSHSPDHPDAVNAVNNAHYVWQKLDDSAVAKRLGPNLVELRRRVPGPNGRDLKAARVRLEMLDAAPGNTSASAAANAPAKAEEQAPTRAPEKTENAGNAAPSSSSDSPTAHSGLEAIE